MSIGPVELGGVVGRAQDFSTIKQNEDNKGLVDQTNFHNKFEQKINQNTKTVQEGDNADGIHKRFDPSEKGDNEYEGDGGRNRKKKQPEDGKVVIKNKGGFDIKI